MDKHAFELKHPTLWHLTHADSWPSIEALGLLTAEQVVDRAELGGPAGTELLTSPRKESVRLEIPDIGPAVLPSQDPFDEARLSASLETMTVAEWLKLLSQHVFFFPTEIAANVARASAAWAEKPVVILQVRTRSLQQSYGALVRLTSITTGNMRPVGAPGRRGHATFKPVGAHSGVVKEVAVLHGISDVREHLSRVEVDVPGEAPSG